MSDFEPRSTWLKGATWEIPVKPGTAVLWIYGSRDKIKFANRRGYAFDKLPPHPLHAYITIDAGHLDTPNQAKEIVATWLTCLEVPDRTIQ